jgi:hypothetical protein
MTVGSGCMCHVKCGTMNDNHEHIKEREIHKPKPRSGLHSENELQTSISTES